MTRGIKRHTMPNKAVKWTDFFCPSYRIQELLTLLVKPQKDLVPTMKSACRIFAIQNSIAYAICAKCANLPSRMGYFCEKKRRKMKAKNEMRKLDGTKVKKVVNFLSFIPARGCSNFVYAEVKTGMSPSRQGHVVSLLTWLEAEVWQAYHKVLTLK